MATTDSDGSFDFEDLDAGHYMLTASAYAAVTTGVERQEDGTCVVKTALGGTAAGTGHHSRTSVQSNR